MKAAPEQYRLKKHPVLGSDSSYGNNGMFIIPHYRINDYEIRCQISDGQGWEHVSITVARKKEDATRCPTWAEMCFVKDLFFNKEETVMQLHPPHSEYVNNHAYCLHLWRPTSEAIPLPPSIFVGLKNIDLATARNNI
jgi:hypothetical protein